MQTALHSALRFILPALLVLAVTGCSPKNKLAGHLAKAEAHFTAGRYDEAEIEYKNVLQLESQNPVALGRMGIIYFDQSRVVYARPLLTKASELAPDNHEVRLKLGFTDLAMRDFAGARAKALYILDRVPTHPEAPLLLAESTTNPKEVEEVRTRLQQLPPAVIDSAPVQLALGSLDLRLNKVDAAEAAFQRALALAPKTPEPHTAMGAIHLVRKNLPAAGQEFKLAADLSPPRSPKRIQSIQFQLQNNEAVAGRQALVKMTETTPDYLPSWMLLAQLHSTDKKYDEALAITSRVLGKDNTYPEALLLNARLLMAKGEFAKAVTELERALKIFPASPQFLYQMALAYVATNESRKAIDVLNQALAQMPDYTDASLLLAGLNMRVGDQGTAISALQTVIRKHPELIQPRLLLADALRSRGNLPEALSVYDSVEKDFAGNPRTPMLKGMVLMQQGNRAAARQAFNLTLQRDPEFQPAIEQLVALDVAEKQFPAALQRVQAQIAKKPQAAELQILLAKVYLAQKQMDQVEATLLKAIELDPASPTGFFMLSGLYLATNQQQRALDNLQKILANNPKDLKAIMMTGLLNEQLQKYDLALAAYEKLLALNPKSGIALNNAAVLYSEHFNQLDKAFEAAQKARELFPNEPHMADTLGWILVKRRQLPWALTLLQESADKLPDSAEVQYHLGTVHYLMGEEELARATYEKALKLQAEFPGAAEARKRLALLAIETSKTGTAERKLIEAAVAAQPDDPVALARLAALQERAGDFDQAEAGYQAVLKASPGNVRAMLSLVRVYTQQKEPAKAIEQAKAIRKVAPDNATATLALGRLVYQTRDYPYAYSLLQEASRKLTDDPALLRDLARAAYSVGRVAEAETAMQRSLQLDGLTSEAVAGRAFLDLVALAANPVQAVAAKARVAQILKATPNDVPALMADAVASEQRADAAAAKEGYEKVLEQYPDFNPAKKRLTILHAANPGNDKKAVDLALKARTAYPDDAELAQAFGTILYRQGDYARAVTMLKEAAAKRADQPEAAYYLGLTQHRLKDVAGAKASLQRALDLKLKPELATEARKVLAELK